MSEEVAVGEPQVEPVVEPEKDLAAELDKWKAMSRKNEARAKENESAARRLSEIEDANRSELEKAQARAEAAEKALSDREAEAERARLVAEVAGEYGVSADVLRGGTRDEVEAHAAAIKALIPDVPKSPGNFASGKVGDPPKVHDQIASVDDLQKMTTEQINEARRDGRLDRLMGKI